MNISEATALFEALQKYDTPTVCNAIEIVKGGRQGDGFTEHPVYCADPRLPPMVGFAKTAKIAGREPPKLSNREAWKIRERYHNYLTEEPSPSVVVIEDTDWPSAIACFFGEVNVAVHKGLGLRGVLTSGLIRDLDTMAPGFPLIGSNVGVSHAHVHVKEVGGETDIMGMRVRSGDVVHADRHGAVVIEKILLPNILEGIREVVLSERIVIDAALTPGFNSAKLNTAWKKFADRDPNS